MNKEMLNQAINEAPMFNGAPMDTLKKYLAECKTHRLQSGQVLIAPGEQNKFIYLVLSGSLSIHLDNQKSPSIRTVKVGGTVGELSLINSGKTSAYVISNNISNILIINRKSFWSIVNKMPIIARNLLEILSSWIVATDKTTLEHQRHIQELEGIALVDGLTGINNRRAFDNMLTRFLNRSTYGKHPLILIMIDVDYFKIYNDTHGHIGGDQALIALAATLRDTVRPGDFVYRYGGEEFAIILPNTRLKQCRNVAERVRQAVINTKIFMPDGSPLPSITISMGVAESILTENSEVDLKQRADKKLYEAKESGRNKFCM
ncbi:MAG: GGDEF domain-containing protein [Magnetococcales bacterium]|nr:GGDEF domain-containing protein [Magnetococcales bacterium]